MKRTLIANIIICTIFNLNAQKAASLQNPFAKTIKAQITYMGDALIKKDYVNFVKYLNPDIIKMGGGEAKIIETTKKSIASLATNGAEMQKIIVGNPSAIVKVNNELQCTVPETLELKSAGGVMLTYSTFIAISKDEGKNWTFFDTNSKNIATIKKSFPNLSSALKIVEKRKPEIKK
jgi:hypothetical protein